MLYRVIARIGYTRGEIEAVQSTLRTYLLGAGLINTMTGTFESEAMELGEVTACFNHLLTELSALDDIAGPHLKHLWLYIDRPISLDPAEALLGSAEE